jgi:hypothetical protein
VEYTIKSATPRYLVFEAGSAEPMDEPDAQALYGWLRNRGMSTTEAVALIEKVNLQGEATVELPKSSN